MCLDNTTVGSNTNHLGVSTLTFEQSDSSEDNALACSCLSRDNGKPGVHVDVEFLDNREIPYI